MPFIGGIAMIKALLTMDDFSTRNTPALWIIWKKRIFR